MNSVKKRYQLLKPWGKDQKEPFWCPSQCVLPISQFDPEMSVQTDSTLSFNISTQSSLFLLCTWARLSTVVHYVTM